jgi:hypothetical protein
MRIIPFLLLLLPVLAANGQSENSRWHGAVGITEGTLNFQQNAAGAVAIPVRFDFLSGHNSALSLGTNLKIGSADEYGYSFPVILVLLALLGASGAQPDLSGTSSSSNSSNSNGYSVNLFADFPLMLEYNWGLGTVNTSDHHVGWFMGAGATYTTTGVTLTSAGHGTSENFFGWTGNIGIRFARNKELSFSTTLPFQNSVGPIRHPLFLALTFAVTPRPR